MLIRQRTTNRAQQGFTMMEVLGVVAILAIIFALVAPNVVQTQKSMRTMELNAKAEQIYNAVQYRLTALQSAGRLGELTKECEEEKEISSNKITSSAALASVVADKKYTLYFARKGGSGNSVIDDYLLPPDDTLVTQGVTSGNFQVEFSPQTGEVYSVFYWESSAGTPAPATLDAARTSPDRLADLQVGYYGGGTIEGATESDSTTPNEGDTKLPVGKAYAGFEDEEELYLKILSGSFGTIDPSKLEVTLTITAFDNDGKLMDFASSGWVTTKWQHTFTGNDSRIQQSGDEVDIILDSMYDDPDHYGKTLGFQELLEIYKDSYIVEGNQDYIAQHQDIKPGSNVRVSMEVKYNGASLPICDYETYATSGSDLQVNTWDMNTAYDSYDPVKNRIELSCMRHFNNLRKNLISFDWNGTRYDTIAITNTINYDGSEWDVSSVALSHRSGRDSDPNYDLNPLSARGEAMEAIDLASQYKEAGAEFRAEVDDEGNPYTLRNFVIGKPPAEGQSADSNRSERSGMYETALFKETGKVSLVNIVMENPHVYGGERTGALVAYIGNGGGKLVNCKVVGGIVDGTKDVGGLIGFADTIPLDGLSAAVDVSGGENVGGLLGHASNNTGNGKAGISNCTVNALKDDDTGVLSLVTVSGTTNVGGLIGYQYMGSAADCYAVCNVVGKGSSAGGFFGLAESSASYERCQVRGVYSAAEGKFVIPTVSSSGSRVGGFAGTMKGNATAKYCFAAVPVYAENAANSIAQYYGGFAGISEGSAAMEHCYSSGDVRANSNVGGFVGAVVNNNGLKSCYATSNVEAYSYAGGFTGQIQTDGWPWSNDYAYGRVVMLSGGNASTFGGFFGNATVGLQGRLTSNGCNYLRMNGYNDALEKNSAEGQPSGLNFGELASGGATPARSHPYASYLQGEAFPFALADGLEHYGDWPAFEADE